LGNKSGFSKKEEEKRVALRKVKRSKYGTQESVRKGG